MTGGAVEKQPLFLYAHFFKISLSLKIGLHHGEKFSKL